MQIVNIADLGFITEPQGRLKTVLGSCVATVVYDPENQVAGMCHVLLPSPPRLVVDDPLKYAETAIPFLIVGVLSRGGKRENLLAKIAGGADMFFRTEQPDFEPNKKNSIGMSNIIASRMQLKKSNIKLVGEDVGGTWGRSALFDLETQHLTVTRLDTASTEAIQV